MNPSSWSLGRRVTALTAAVAAVLALLASSAMVTAAANRADTSHVMDELTPALVNSGRLNTGLLRQQSSARTFSLTGKDDDLAAYREAAEDEQKIVADTERLLRDEPALRDGVRRIADAIAAYRRDVIEPNMATTRANGPSLAVATPTDQSRASYRVAADAITQFEATLTTRRDEVRRQVSTSGNALVALLIAAAVTIVLAGIGLAILLRRVITDPVTELAVEVRRVARGDYDYEIKGGGPPELARLARDVNAMRQQISSDLTEVRQARRQIEEANLLLEQQTEELTRSNRDLEQFAYVASHDLQEPLRKVASFCQLLQRRYVGKLDERADQYIAFAVDGAQRMQRLINDLLAFSRIGRITSGFADVDLNKVVIDAAAQFDSAREYVQGEITFENLPSVRGEEPLLGALFANLVGNALKFRHPDRTPHVHVAATRDGDWWEVSVEDNGIGISPEFADKVFVIFQRLHAKEAYPGTGIGLAIAKKIVEYHGGRIWIDPDRDEGTLFRFTLPAVDTSAVVEAEQDQPAPVQEIAV